MNRTVLLVGGHGGLTDRYREAAAAAGFALVHYERRVPGGAGLAGADLIVVPVTLVSHQLRDRILQLAGNDIPIVYIRSASISALRAALVDAGRLAALPPAPPERVERACGWYKAASK